MSGEEARLNRKILQKTTCIGGNEIKNFPTTNQKCHKATILEQRIFIFFVIMLNIDLPHQLTAFILHKIILSVRNHFYYNEEHVFIQT